MILRILTCNLATRIVWGSQTWTNVKLNSLLGDLAAESLEE